MESLKDPIWTPIKLNDVFKNTERTSKSPLKDPETFVLESVRIDKDVKESYLNPEQHERILKCPQRTSCEWNESNSFLFFFIDLVSVHEHFGIVGLFGIAHSPRAHDRIASRLFGWRGDERRTDEDGASGDQSGRRRRNEEEDAGTEAAQGEGGGSGPQEGGAHQSQSRNAENVRPLHPSAIPLFSSYFIMGLVGTFMGGVTWGSVGLLQLMWWSRLISSGTPAMVFSSPET